MHFLVALILTKNEAENITDCVSALLGWTDAVIVWDSGSTDATQQLAYLAGANVIERPFDNYAAQRQAALDTVNADWVLFIDADERVTPALRDEILRAVEIPTPSHAADEDAAGAQDNTSTSRIDGYWIPRRNFIAGKETRGGGFYPDYQLRLLRRANARYVSEREVHEIVEVDGAEGYLKEPLVHYNYRTWSQFHDKQRGYARYEARILRSRGIRPRPHNFILQPLREFRRRFITLGGWRDGIQGLRLALLLAWYYGFKPYWLLLREREDK